jgi:hypothetical protein
VCIFFLAVSDACRSGTRIYQFFCRAQRSLNRANKIPRQNIVPGKPTDAFDYFTSLLAIFSKISIFSFFFQSSKFIHEITQQINTKEYNLP